MRAKKRNDKARGLRYNFSVTKALRDFFWLSSSFITFLVAGCGGGGGVGGTESKLTGQWAAEKLNSKGDRILLIFNESQIAGGGGFPGTDGSPVPEKGGKTVRIVAVRPAGEAYSVDEGQYSIKESRLYFDLTAVDDFNSPYTLTTASADKPGTLTLGSEVYFQVTGDPAAGPQLGGQIQISQSASDEAVTTASIAVKSDVPHFVPGEILVKNKTSGGGSSQAGLGVSSGDGNETLPPFSIIKVDIEEEAPSASGGPAALGVEGGSSAISIATDLPTEMFVKPVERHDRSMAATLKGLKECRARLGRDACGLNYIIRTQSLSAPTDTYYDEQWNLDAISATDAWGIVGASPPKQTVVAVIDTGIVSNPDLDAKILKKGDGTYWGYDFVHDKIDGIPDLDLDTTATSIYTPNAADKAGHDPIPIDPCDKNPLLPEGCSWHGTHIAGIVAAAIDNAEGVAGIATNVRIMPLRAMGYRGNGTLADVAQAIRYAAKLQSIAECTPFTALNTGGGSYDYNPATWACTIDAARPKADIINLSLGGAMDAASADILNLAINDAVAAGVIVVAAAGNDAKEPGWCLNEAGTAWVADASCNFYPAANPNVIAVSAVYSNLNFASSYSNKGKDGNNPIDIAAPGGSGAQGVLSTVHPSSYGKYGMLTGTSQAAAHVSGVAALVWSDKPVLTKDQIRTALLSSAIDLGNAGVDNYYGSGLLNACGAVAKGRELAGAPLAGAGALKLSAENVDFSSLGTSQTVLLTGGCGPMVTITKAIKHVNSGGSAWLEVKLTSGTTPSQLQLKIKRDGLVPGDYTATVTVQSSAGDKVVNIAMKVGNTSIAGAKDGDIRDEVEGFLKDGTTDGFDNTIDLGEIVILLIDADSGEAKYYTKTDLTADYHFQFAGFAPGEYYILGGSDENDDGKICVAGEMEPCFSYPNYASPEPFDVTATTKKNDIVIQY